MMRDPQTLATAVAAAGTATLTIQGPEVLGIGVGVLMGACAGALFGLANTPPEKWGKLLKIPDGTPAKRYGWICLRAGGLVFTLAGIAFVAGWTATALPHFPLTTWTAPIPAIPLAGLLAYAGQHVFPRAISAATRWIDNRGGKAP